ncbi:unnamed protein product [Auanema sp. JU1783]|nr:unnamed protein product [Auanema sp. JU1783]
MRAVTIFFSLLLLFTFGCEAQNHGRRDFVQGHKIRSSESDSHEFHPNHQKTSTIHFHRSSEDTHSREHFRQRQN